MTKKTNDWMGLLNVAYTSAEQTLVNTGGVSPMFVIHGADRSMAFLADIGQSPEAKERILDLMKVVAISEGAAGVSFMSEVWMRSIKPRPGESDAETKRRAINETPPSESPDRVEAVIALTTWRDQNGRMHSVSKTGEIIRDAEGKATGLKEAHEIAENEGRFSTLVPVRTPTARERRLAKEFMRDVLGVDIEAMAIKPLSLH